MALLLIPEAVNKILERGRKQGREEARQAERERIRQLIQEHSPLRTLEEAEILFEKLRGQ